MNSVVISIVDIYEDSIEAVKEIECASILMLDSLENDELLNVTNKGYEVFSRWKHVLMALTDECVRRKIKP